ncbi:MAG: HAMP domain-containing protein, partial [Alphaproteobacteria bacterium]|nr:HAMP domain-containing protein [Alphaproteobacteria bacterium]
MSTPPLVEPIANDSAAAAGLRERVRAGMKRVGTGYRLQLVLFTALVLISAVPVLLLAAWVQSDALEKEVRSVTEKHLLLAENLSGVLERYVTDVREAFRVAADNAYEIENLEGFDKLLRSLNFRYVAKFDARDGMIGYVMRPLGGSQSSELPSTVRADLRALAAAEPGEVVISDLVRVGDSPMFFVVSLIEEDRLVVGALETTFLKIVQRAIVFGERGHSMIVDAKGRVVAHPDSDWEATSKDASGLSVVQKMMRGETGVATFFSPPMQADMIAGYTSVPGVGWGVMVPQPFQELEENADDVRNIAILLTVIGILVAAVLGWLLARYIARPIVAVSSAAAEVTAGGMHTRVADLPDHSPRELRLLADSFNAMIAELEQREKSLREAKDEAETANQSKS